MSLIAKTDVNTKYWSHKCSAKEGSVTHTPNGTACFQCKKTKEESVAAGEQVENT